MLCYFFLLVGLILSTSFVQTKLGRYVTNQLNKDFNVSIVIKKVHISFFGSVYLKEVDISDHHNERLIFIENLSTSLLNASKIVDNKLDLGTISLTNATFIMKTYKGEQKDNLDVFIDSFDEDLPEEGNSSPFILKSSRVNINNLHYQLIDENEQIPLIFSTKNTAGFTS